MGFRVENPYARDPAMASEVVEEEGLGCWLCRHSRASDLEAYCAPAKRTGAPVSRIRFPIAGQTCPEFKRRADW
jgi:hypothetical protein